MPAVQPAIVAGLKAQLRRDRRADPPRQRWHRHRRDRSRTDAHELERLGDAHRRTLDQLTTGVAIFNAGQHLVFYNASLSGAVGASMPDFSTSIRPMQACSTSFAPRGSCPRRRDFREWKAALHEAYRATEPQEHLWHLPDSRTIRVVTTPNPQGGVTYLFDDVTESLQLARRFDALIRVQRETLDNLAEAVAVFGSDGRLRLHNPASPRCGG